VLITLYTTITLATYHRVVTQETKAHTKPSVAPRSLLEVLQ
jgi:hypothetical protein